MPNTKYSFVAMSDRPSRPNRTTPLRSKSGDPPVIATTGGDQITGSRKSPTCMAPQLWTITASAEVSADLDDTDPSGRVQDRRQVPAELAG